MARLPAPVTEELVATYDEEYEQLQKTLFRSLGQLVRIAESEKARKEGEKSES